MWPPAKTITISADPIAKGASAPAPLPTTVQPMVNTRKNVPTSSVMYLFILIPPYSHLLRGAGTDAAVQDTTEPIDSSSPALNMSSRRSEWSKGEAGLQCNSPERCTARGSFLLWRAAVGRRPSGNLRRIQCGRKRRGDREPRRGRGHLAHGHVLHGSASQSQHALRFGGATLRRRHLFQQYVCRL